MKKKQLLILSMFLCFFANSFGQNINFKDANFKRLLVAYDNGRYGTYDSNRDGEISFQEARNITRIDFYGQKGDPRQIKDLTGIEHFTNIEVLVMPDQDITNLDLSRNTKLKSYKFQK